MTVKTKVISIAAVSGGGKTTVTNRLCDKLVDSKGLFFDDYDFKDSPLDLVKWVEGGPDYDQWNLDPLITDIHSKVNSLAPSYLVVDYPFAYKNHSMKDLIDLAVYIDTPLDIAMARRILRDHKNSSASEIHNDVDFYLSGGRGAYIEMENMIKTSSDLVIDGTMPVDKIVDVILQKVLD